MSSGFATQTTEKGVIDDLTMLLSGMTDTITIVNYRNYQSF